MTAPRKPRPCRIEAMLRGATRADDERLRAAEERVWPGKTWGCDAPEMMANEIAALREKVEHLRSALHARLDHERIATERADRAEAEAKRLREVLEDISTADETALAIRQVAREALADGKETP